MKRIVCARKSTLKLMAALKTAGEKQLSSSKEDNLAQELESEYNQLTSRYEKVIENLRSSKATASYETDFATFWNFISKTHEHQKRLWGKCKDLQHLASVNSSKLQNALKNAQTGQESIEELRKALEAAWLTVDATNAREQVAQESIEALRQQIAKLKSELDVKNKMLQTEADGPTMKNKEMLAREKERSQMEVVSLKQKLDAVRLQHQELEVKKSSSENKVQELLIELESKESETAREVRLRQKIEEELKRENKKISDLTDEVTQLKAHLELSKKTISEVESNLKQVTAINEHIIQKNEILSTTLIKSQNDLQNKSVSHDAANQRITSLVTQLKMLEEDLRKLNGELKKTNKMRDTFQRRIQEAEAKNNLNLQEKKRLKMKLAETEKEKETALRERDQEKKLREVLLNELEIVNSNLLKAAAANQEETKTRKMQEQLKKDAEINLDKTRKELSKLKVIHNNLEKDKEKSLIELRNLHCKLEMALEEGSKKQMTITNLKKELEECRNKLNDQQTLLDTVRAEKNNFCKHLHDTEEELDSFKQKFKLLNHQIEQLKEDIKMKESQLIKEQSKLQKLEKEKETLHIDIKAGQNELKDMKEAVNELKKREKNLNSVITELDKEKKNKVKDLEKMIGERDLLNSQLMRRNEELEAANQRIQTMTDALQKGELQYAQRVDDIRLLKLEVVKLRAEKVALRRSLSNLGDCRQQIFTLERDLTKERVKCRALEEELQNPLNIHRWRKLEGSDPECYHLINKMQSLQKRVLAKTSEVVEKDEQLAEVEKLYANLKVMLSRQPGPDVVEKLKTSQLSLQQKSKKIQALTGQLEAAEAQALEYKAEIDKCRLELNSFKKKYYEQKQEFGKRRHEKSIDETSTDLITRLSKNMKNDFEKLNSPKATKIIGGGFSMIVTPPRTVNKSSTISRIK